MESIGVKFNPRKPIAAAVADRAITILLNSGAKAVMSEELERSLQGNAQLSALLAIGGDGTILHAAVGAAKSGVPILGVNVGRVGFLSGAQQDELDTVVRRVLQKDFEVDSRAMLWARSGHDNEMALNEVLVYRSIDCSVLHLNVFVDGARAAQLACDGLVISTPTGSTAYSLSAGGPVVAPQADVTLITPVCAHSLSSRPIVVPGSSILRVDIEESTGAIFTDGKLWKKTVAERTCDMSVAEPRAKFIRFQTNNFFELLHKKLK